MTVRDPENSGAVTLMHPWESGLDNSPVWDDALHSLTLTDLPKYQRKDLAGVSNASERPDNATYNRFIFLLHTMRKYNYDHKAMYNEYPFKIKDIVTTSILYVANKYMLKIADLIGEDTKKIRRWLSRIENNFYMNFVPTGEQLGETEENLFYNYDLVNKVWIRKQTVASFIPIYAGLITRKDIDRIVRWLTHSHWCGDGNCHVPSIPSADLEESYFKSVNYWRGPVWINTNWLIYLGLLKYGYEEEAEHIKQGTFELAQNHGFREYFDPYTGEGLGGKAFSWTAALVIDMIENKGIGIPPD